MSRQGLAGGCRLAVRRLLPDHGGKWLVLFTLLFSLPATVTAQPRTTRGLEMFERRLAELEEDLKYQLDVLERQLEREAKVIEEVERAMEALDSPQVYTGVEMAIERLNAAVRESENEPQLPADLIAALRRGEEAARRLRSNPTSPERQVVLHDLHHSVLDLAHDVVREDVIRASEINIRVAASMIRMRDQLSRILAMRSSVVVGTIMPRDRVR